MVPYVEQKGLEYFSQITSFPMTRTPSVPPNACDESREDNVCDDISAVKWHYFESQRSVSNNDAR